MRQMQPVLWTKGVLLTPQHLQVQDQFLEDLLEFQRSALAFAPWGFSRLELDPRRWPPVPSPSWRRRESSRTASPSMPLGPMPCRPPGVWRGT